MKRYYYKTKDGKGLLNLKSPLSKEEAKNYVVLTQAEFESLQPKKSEPTAAQLADREKKAEVARLKHYLSSTDYVVIKIAEGAATAEEYASVIAERQAARTRINELEGE